MTPFNSPGVAKRFVDLGNAGDAQIISCELDMMEKEELSAINVLPFGATLLSMSIVFRGMRSDLVVAELLARGADPNEKVQGLTPLMIAAGNGFASAVPLLVAAGADIEATNDEGETALLVACQQLEARVVAHLIRFGANREHVSQKGWVAQDYVDRSIEELNNVIPLQPSSEVDRVSERMKVLLTPSS